MARLPSRLARRPGTRAGLVALLALVALAQLHGIQHGVSHVGLSPGAADGTGLPHTIVCTDCVASAEAGAAPLLADIAPRFVPGTAGPESRPAPVTAGRTFTAAYRSRAPPATPI